MKNTSTLNIVPESLQVELLNHGFNITESKDFDDVVFAWWNTGNFNERNISVEYRSGSNHYLVLGNICKTERDVVSYLKRIKRAFPNDSPHG